MVDIADNIGRAYAYVIDDLSDERTNDLPLMSSPGIVVLIVAAYLYFCISLGPMLMKNRKAFDLITAIKYYNILQILLSTFLVYEGLIYLLNRGSNLACDPDAYKNDTIANRTARCAWWYFFAKITELTETVFFVFRKKSRQISTLHLYHHTLVVISSWIAVKYFPVGPIVLVGTLNSFVHILMYTYYFLSGLGPQFQKYLWWKKYITLIQLIQFGIVIAHNGNALFSDCKYPKIIHILIMINTGILTYMFSKFYYHNYIKVKPNKVDGIKQKPGVKDVHHNKRKSLSVGQ